MGGWGSGRRWYSGAKNTTEHSWSLDIRKLRRAGVLTPNRWFSWQWTIDGKPAASTNVLVETERVILAYRYRNRTDNQWQKVRQPVYIVRTPCTYGGTRPWWLCPSCSRRVAVLYNLGRLYACRHCHQLVYASQRENANGRARRRADKIRQRLGWEAGILNPKGGKPKWMRWRTFQRLTAEHDALVGELLGGMVRQLGIPKVFDMG